MAEKEKSTLKRIYQRIMGTKKPSAFSIPDVKKTIDKRKKRLRDVMEDKHSEVPPWKEREKRTRPKK